MKWKSLGTEKGGIQIKSAFYSVTVHRILSCMIAWESQSPCSHSALLGRWRAGNTQTMATTSSWDIKTLSIYGGRVEIPRAPRGFPGREVSPAGVWSWYASRVPSPGLRTWQAYVGVVHLKNPKCPALRQSEWLWLSETGCSRAMIPGWVDALAGRQLLCFIWSLLKKNAFLQNVSVSVKWYYPLKSCSDRKIPTITSKFTSAFAIFHGDSVSFSHQSR